MRDAVIVLNPREIRECVTSFAELPVPKVWITGFSEREISEGIFLAVLAQYDFDRYFVVSDDVIVRPYAFDAIRHILDLHLAPVATGYSQRSHADWTVNLTRKPLMADWPVADAYDFLHFREVVSHSEPVLETWFTGMSLTGMSREMWQRFPFQAFVADESPRGFASDFHLSKRLQDEGIPILAAREGFAYHWRHEWRNTNHPGDAKPCVSGEKGVTLT